VDAKEIIGRCVRRLREEKGWSQEKLASSSNITYQYLSGLENGRQNFTLDIAQSLATSLEVSLDRLVALAYADARGTTHPTVNPTFFRPHVPLPPPLSVEQLRDALNEAQRVVFLVNSSLGSLGARPLSSYIQGNNFSGLVSNLLCDALSQHSPFKHNSHKAYPDLISTGENGESVGLEVKTTIQVGKGGESHNGHSGWHLIACYKLKEDGSINFLHIMVAVLNGHTEEETDWNYLGSRVNAETGSRRTETYSTNAFGTTKLRDGSVYLDTDAIPIARWRQLRRDHKPDYSPFTK